VVTTGTPSAMAETTARRSVAAVAVGADAAAFAAELVAVLTDRQAWERRRRAIDDLAPPDPAIAGRWTDVLDATRHARLPQSEAVTG